MATLKKAQPKILNSPDKVREFMTNLEHPLKAEIEAIRTIILDTHKQITEGIKWNAPCFYYKGDMAVFNLHAKEHVHLVFPAGVVIKDGTGLLEGDYKDGRRMAYFRNLADVKSKKDSLQKVVKAWVTSADKGEQTC